MHVEINRERMGPDSIQEGSNDLLDNYYHLYLVYNDGIYALGNRSK